MPGYQNTQILEGSQAGLETVRATAVAATRRLYGRLVPTFNQAEEDFSEQTRSFHAHTAHALGRPYVTFSYSERMSYEDIPWWLQLALKGGVAGVTTGSTPPGYTYAFTPSSATDDLKTATIEFGDPGNVYEAPMFAVNRLTMRWDATTSGDATWMMEIDAIGREQIVSAFTAALAERARDLILARGTKVYIDEPGGTIGTTLKTNYVRSGSITIDNQIETKEFSENATAIAPDFARGEQLITGEIVMEFKDDLEFAKMRAGTSRRLRFLQEGLSIGITPTTLHKWQVDIPIAQWRAPSQQYLGQNKVHTMGFMGYKNTVDTSPIVATVVNDLITLP